MAKRMNLMGLQFMRVKGVLDLQAPKGYKASVLLKSDGAARYVWWLSVGRHDSDALKMPFDCNGASFIRCDVPEDHLLSEQAIHNGLDAFLKSKSASAISGTTVADPMVNGGPNGGNGDGGTGTINP